jgi:hypothetical protein
MHGSYSVACHVQIHFSPSAYRGNAYKESSALPPVQKLVCGGRVYQTYRDFNTLCGHSVFGEARLYQKLLEVAKHFGELPSISLVGVAGMRNVKDLR